MIEKVKETLEHLLSLLSYSKAQQKKLLSSLMRQIEKETLNEIREGVHSNNHPDSLVEARNMIGNNETIAILETTAARILVHFFSEEKIRYSAQEREIFLTFLLTNKLQRVLDTLKK